MKSEDEAVEVEIEAEAAKALPASSIFSSVDTASKFFEGGSVGYSITSDPDRLDVLELVTKEWRVEPLQTSHVHSSYFEDEAKFPPGSIEFDHALIMRESRA